MEKKYKIIRRLLKTKFIKNKYTNKDLKIIYHNIKHNTNTTNTFTQECNFLINILSLEPSLKCIPSLIKYTKYRLTESDIERVETSMSHQDKILFINDDYDTNQRCILLYRKQFKVFFKYQIYNTQGRMHPTITDYIKYGTAFCLTKIPMVDLSGLKQNKPYELKFFDYKDDGNNYRENKHLINTRNKDIPSNNGILNSIVFKCNIVQKTVAPVALHSDSNFVVCAPTGVGKTLIGIMSIHRLVNTGNNIKVAYIAPIKALVAEITDTIQKEFPLLKVYECTSDTQISKIDLFKFNILVGTPEKIDVLMRNNYTLRFNLLIIDELHFLNETRGHVLESLVIRSKIYKYTRLVGLSATVYNYKDIGLFLDCYPSDIFYFDESYRPVNINYKYLYSKNYKEDLLDLIQENKGPFLVFVHLRKETFVIASYIRSYKNIQVGIHHSGLSKEEKKIVEEKVRNGTINILVSTSTLAYGINLPIQTVIVLGIKYYNKEGGCWETLSSMSIKQMMGRAGRYINNRKDGTYKGMEKDTIANEHNITNYHPTNITNQSFCNGYVLSDIPSDSFFYTQTIESNFLLSIHNILLSHIDLLNSISEIYTWFTCSFFFIRLKSINPNYIQYSLSILNTVIKELISAKALDYKLKCTHLGKIVVKYCVDYKEVYKFYQEIGYGVLDGVYLDLIDEFSGMKDIEPEEVREVENISNTSIRTNVNSISSIPVKSIFGRVFIDTFDRKIRTIPSSVKDNISRIMKCAMEISLYKKLIISRQAIFYYKLTQCDKLKNIKDVKVEYDFYNKYLVINIKTINNAPVYILIFNTDILLVKDLVLNGTHVYKIKRYKYYTLDLLGYTTTYTKRITLIRNKESDNIIKIYKRKVVKSLFMDFYDRLNDMTLGLPKDSKIVVGSTKGEKYLSGYFTKVVQDDIKDGYIRDDMVRDCITEGSGNIRDDLNDPKRYSIGDTKTTSTKSPIKIPIGPYDIVVKKKKYAFKYYCIQNKTGITSSSYNILSELYNNMNMTSIIKLIFSIPDMYIEIPDGECINYNGKEYGKGYLVYIQYLYNDTKISTGIINSTPCMLSTICSKVLMYLNILLDISYKNKYMKTVFNIIFIIQRTYKLKEVFHIKVEGNELVIESGRSTTFYIINKEYMEKINITNIERVRVEIGKWYVLSEYSKGYEVAIVN